MTVDGFGGGKLFVLLGRYALVETGVNLCANVGFDYVPHFRLARATVTLLRQFVVGVHLHTQVLARVDELDEQRERVAKLLVHAFADQQTFVLVNELGEVETEINVTYYASLGNDGFVSGYTADLPRLTDVRLRGVDTFERCYLIPAPDSGAEVGLELIRFHVY